MRSPEWDQRVIRHVFMGEHDPEVEAVIEDLVGTIGLQKGAVPRSDLRSPRTDTPQRQVGSEVGEGQPAGLQVPEVQGLASDDAGER